MFRALAGAKCKSRTALSILACEKKKRMLKSLIYTLRIIKTLYETEFHLKDSIEVLVSVALFVQIV